MVLDQYDRHGRKDLSWQQGITPYQMRVSETTLQQTQASTVFGYSNCFMATLPDVEVLAMAAEGEVLHLWTGPDYYSHAHNLYKTMQIVVKRHVGESPHDVEQPAELSGIGRFAAGAIANLSMGLCVPILDGNTKCVLACYLTQDGYPDEPKMARALWEVAGRFTPHARANHYTQAIINLGITLRMCSKPSYLLYSPVSGCRAHLLDRGADYPQPESREALPQRRTLMSILANRGGAILFYRQSSSRL